MYDDGLEAGEMAQLQVPSQDEADRLYNQYVKPLEASHRGQYAAVSYQGDVVIASSLVEVVQKAVATFGKANSVTFHVGDRVVGRIR
jgi:hypothetical protein